MNSPYFRILSAVLHIAALHALFLGSSSSYAQSEFLTEDTFVEDVILENLPISTSFAFAPENTIFLAQKDGIVRVAKNGVLLPTPFVDISAVTNRVTDRGLLGLAVDPDFPSRPYLYLLHVYDPPGMAQDSQDPRVIRLIRIEADAEKNYQVALADTAKVILGSKSLPEWIAAPFDKNSLVYPEPASCMTGLTIDGIPVEDCLPADAKSHSAGTLLFGPDRSLYVSLGDGSSYDTANRPALRAQMLDSLAGKILRINPDTGGGLKGNPFFNPAKPNSNRSKVWAYGLRNPFRITLNPGSGQVYAGDVGSSSWEEINGGKGANFGWPCYEGGVSPQAQESESGDTASLVNTSYARFSRTRDLCSPVYELGESGVQSPVFSYAHQYIDGKDMGGSATGVAFYTGKSYPSKYRGSLFIADYSLRWLRYLTFDALGKASVNDFAREVGSGLGIVELKAGSDTNIYALYLDLKTRSSQLRRFRFAGDANVPPRVSITASPDAGTAPLVVQFRSNGTYDPDGQELSYAWDFADGTFSKETNPRHVFTSVGTFDVRLTVSEKSAPFAATTRSVTVRTGATPPKAIIDLPSEGSTYSIGDTVTFSGRAVFDGQEGDSNATLSWAIIQHHNDHTHLEKEITSNSGSFQVEEHADNTWYEVCLLVTIPEGMQDQVCREIKPKKGTLSLLSDPVGAPITYVEEQIEVLAPYTASPIWGSRRSVIAKQVHASRSFIGWSDGEASMQRSFTINSPSLEYKAIYKNLPPVAQIISSSRSVGITEKLQLDASNSSDPEKSLLRYRWDLGDGDTSSDALVTHSYKAPGSYVVTLQVEDKLGSQSTDQITVTVNRDATGTPTSTPTPRPGVTASPTPTSTPSLTPSPSVPPRTSPSPVPTKTQTPLPPLSMSPTKTPTPLLTPRPLRLVVATRGNTRCLSERTPCRISKKDSLRATSAVGALSSLGGSRYSVSLRIRHSAFQRSVTVPFGPPPIGGTTISRILPRAIFSRRGLYSVTLRLYDQISQRATFSDPRFVLVR